MRTRFGYMWLRDRNVLLDENGASSGTISKVELMSCLCRGACSCKKIQYGPFCRAATIYEISDQCDWFRCLKNFLSINGLYLGSRPVREIFGSIKNATKFYSLSC